MQTFLKNFAIDFNFFLTVKIIFTNVYNSKIIYDNFS